MADFDQTLSRQLEDHIAVLCENGRVPSSAGYRQTQAYLCDQIAALGHNPVRQEFWAIPFGRCCNIYTETGPAGGARILVGAHYETLGRSGPGADDNGAAVAVTLELLRQAPADVPMTFVFFDYEEEFGLGRQKGSKTFARRYNKPIQKAIVFDLVGGAFMPGLDNAYFQFGAGNPRLEAEGLEFFHLPLPFLEPLGACSAPRSDYGAFKKRGIPFTFVSIGTPWYYHTRDDTPARLDYAKMGRLVACLATTLAAPTPDPAPLDWAQFPELMRRVCALPALEDAHFRRLAALSGEPSRLDILKLYFKVLPKLRKLGPDLWQESR